MARDFILSLAVMLTGQRNVLFTNKFDPNRSFQSRNLPQYMGYGLPEEK